MFLLIQLIILTFLFKFVWIPLFQVPYNVERMILMASGLDTSRSSFTQNHKNNLLFRFRIASKIVWAKKCWKSSHWICNEAVILTKYMLEWAVWTFLKKRLFRLVNNEKKIGNQNETDCLWKLSFMKGLY